MSEYGADTIPGLHHSPPLPVILRLTMSLLLSILTRVFFVNELLWNAFDFAIDKSSIHVAVLNNKAIFTRQRQPKSAAFTLKHRYEQLKKTPNLQRIVRTINVFLFFVW